MEEMITAFRAYADVKRISLTYESNFRYMNTWLDKDKMDSILEKSDIQRLEVYTGRWKRTYLYSRNRRPLECEVKDTGIGIPSSEQKKLL